MQELTNITTKKLFSLSQKDFEGYRSLLTYVKTVKGKELGTLSFGQVATIKKALQQPTLEALQNIFSLVYSIEIRNLNTIQFFERFNWIEAELKKIAEREKLLSSSDAIWEQAGGEQLVKFGELNTLRALAMQFSTTPQEVENWTYNLVFTLMYQNKTLNEVQEQYHKLKAK